MAILIALAIALATGSAGMRDEPAREIVGPKRLCFKHSSFQLTEGERVADVRMGVEGMSIGVEGPMGRYRISESEIFRKPTELGRRVGRRDGTGYYRVSDPVRYAVTGRTSFSPDRDALVLWVSGDALVGQRTDAEIYNRVAVGDPAGRRCHYRYLYGGDAALIAELED
jgi:hypothetical protein